MLEVVRSTLVAGVGVTASFALGTLGATRTVDLRRDGHAAAGAYAVLMALAFMVVVAAVFGIAVTTQK